MLAWPRGRARLGRRNVSNAPAVRLSLAADRGRFSSDGHDSSVTSRGGRRQGPNVTSRRPKRDRCPGLPSWFHPPLPFYLVKRVSDAGVSGSRRGRRCACHQVACSPLPLSASVVLSALALMVKAARTAQHSKSTPATARDQSTPVENAPQAACSISVRPDDLRRRRDRS